MEEKFPAAEEAQESATIESTETKDNTDENESTRQAVTAETEPPAEENTSNSHEEEVQDEALESPKNLATKDDQTRVVNVKPAVAKTKEDISLASSASGEGKGRRVSDIISKYSPSPSSARSTKSITSITKIEANLIPDLGSVRAKFEKSGSSSLVFGEAFRQQQRQSRLMAKEKAKEAVKNIRGFDEMVYSQEKVEGEIDESHLNSTFTFEGASGEVQLHGGTCKVKYEERDYQGLVFVVHRTRGTWRFGCVHGRDTIQTDSLFCWIHCFNC